VLEGISIYWNALAFIPIGVLEKIRKISFMFLWSWKKENEGIPLVKWKTIAKPKYLGGRGLKKIQHFGEALGAKCLWRLI
jgi:hypothetical protein